MTRSFRLTITARGSLLVGGGAVPDGLHGAQVADGKGLPYLPASALRGALRESLEAVLRGADKPACEGGNGLSVDAAMGTKPVPCALDGGSPCAACRLFGGGREKVLPGARDFSALVLGDARPVDDAARWMSRPGVAITRSARSAEDDRLFLRRTTATGAVFEAEGHLRDDGLATFFEAAVRATTHLGAGRSRGTARVDLTVTPIEREPAVVEALPQGDLRVTVTLLSPTILGEALASENVRDTRREIPGAALRGAIGFALAQALDDPNDPTFQRLVAEDGARFGFLHPVDPDDAGDAPSGALPITTVACKSHGRAHTWGDALLDRIAFTCADDVEQLERLGPFEACPDCSDALRALHGHRRALHEPAVRALTRVALDRTASSARDTALFTEVCLDAGSTFEGVIRGVPAESRATLARVTSLPLAIGRGRGAGRGRVSLTFAPVIRAPVSERGERFDAALRAHLDARGLPVGSVGRWIPLALLSPWVPAEAGDEWDELAALFPGAICGLRARRFAREGAWDQRGGRMSAWQAVAAGAVYGVALPEGSHWREHLDTLEGLEREGLGRQRHQGYGDVFAFDPMFIERKAGKMTQESQSTVARKPLVVAAEKVMERAFKPGGGREWEVEKTQLNQLIGVCGEATCAEEIENYLRYQASRDRAPWGLKLAEHVIEAVNAVIGEEKDDLQRVRAWRQYAVYLARAYTYRKAVTPEARNDRRG